MDEGQPSNDHATVIGADTDRDTALAALTFIASVVPVVGGIAGAGITELRRAFDRRHAERLAVDWVCERDVDGVVVTARLIADSVGVQSIHVGVPAATPGNEAAMAFVGLLRATSLVGPDQQNIDKWLLAINAADGVMPLSTDTAIARAAARDSEGDPILYVVPSGSSMLLADIARP